MTGEEMSDRQRHREALLFGAPDRIPLSPGSGRESTRERWHREGLPETVLPHQIPEYAYRQAGGKLPWPKEGKSFPVEQRMMPEFEQRVIQRKKDSQVVQDWKGNICEIGNEFTPAYLREAIDFVTRRWIKCPVENDADWAEMKKRYDPKAPARLPENPAAAGRDADKGEAFFGVSFNGPFWQLREWCGFENLCLFLYDRPKLVAEMLEFWKDYVVRLLERTFEYARPDFVHLSEDMAYKGFSMISPKMTRERLLPIYKHWGEIIRRAGVPIYAMDSDGFIGELIPIWIEAGINACDPVEVAAGNDIVKFRKEYGRNMAYRCGVDKRAIARGGAAVEAEIRRIEPVIRDGGYIPGCDHGVPPDVSWGNYVYYTGLLAKATGWM